MKQFLIIQKSAPIKDYIELYLKAYHDVTMVHVESISESLKQLEGSGFDCIFIGAGLVLDGEAKALTEKMKEYITNNTNCKVIGTNKGLSTQDWVLYVPSMAPPAQILETVRNGLNLEDSIKEQKFIAIPIQSLTYFKESPGDIYFRIGSNPEEMTYIKRFNENDPVDNSDLNKYIEKNVKQVYVNPEKIKKISEAISSLISKKVTSGESVDSQIEVATEALDYASYVLESMGINPKSQEIVQGVITTILTSVDKMDKKKAKNFKQILGTKENFYHKHVSLTAILATSILDEMKLEISDESRSALTYAAFFHNFLINNEADISCITEEGLKAIEDPERREKVRNHANLAASFVSDLKGIPYDVQKMIMEQHGSPQGVGFPVSKHTSTQLSSLFMIANEFALKFLINFESKSGENVQKLLKDSLAIYGSSCQKILEALQNCIAGQMAMNK